MYNTEEERGFVLRVKHPMRNATMEYLVGERGIQSRRREHGRKFEGRNSHVILKNEIIATFCKLHIYYPPLP